MNGWFYNLFTSRTKLRPAPADKIGTGAPWDRSPYFVKPQLRTMWGGERRSGAGWIEYIDDDRGPELKSAEDSRVSCRFARFCRRHSIDELPQLWHVISGEMSLVGPRPITERELRRHYGAHAAEVLQVKPGLAGLWQISGRNRLTYAERCRLDLRLVRERSVAMYFAILLRTLPEVFGGENSW
jgi:lipopolysaccharide/colanic/teichoic acid biosynthesis glycosyltransferase